MSRQGRQTQEVGCCAVGGEMILFDYIVREIGKENAFVGG